MGLVHAAQPKVQIVRRDDSQRLCRSGPAWSKEGRFNHGERGEHGETSSVPNWFGQGAFIAQLSLGKLGWRDFVRRLMRMTFAKIC